MKKTIYTLAAVAMAAVTLSSCEDENIAGTLSGPFCKTWEGTISTYYEDRWGLAGDDFSTVIAFYSDDYYLTRGTGSEVDYDINDPYGSYWYSDFEWRVSNGVIELRYADTDYAPVYIYDYNLGDWYFSGYMDDGTNKDIVFDLRARGEFNWDPYYYGYYLPGQKRIAPARKDSTPSSARGKFGSKGAFAKKNNDMRPIILQKGK